MARPTLGGIVLYLLDVKGRRRAASALRRAMPGLDGGELVRLVRASYVLESQTKRSERRAERTSAVKLCRRLRFEGWEGLHNTPREPLFLLAPFGSAKVAARVLGLYREGSRSAVVVPPGVAEDAVEAELFRGPIRCSAQAARLALAEGLAAVWTVALPEGRGRWAVHYLPPAPAWPDDTVDSLTGRYLSVLEGMIRQHPEDWPWRHFG